MYAAIVKIILLCMLQGSFCRGSNVTTYGDTNRTSLGASSTVLLEVTSCSEVYVHLSDTNIQQDFKLVIKPDTTLSSYTMEYQYCNHKFNCITFSKVNGNGSLCNEFLAHWIHFGSDDLTIGKGCTVDVQKMMTFKRDVKSTFPYAMSISSKDIATWKYGATACQPETTTSTTTTTTTITTTTQSSTTTGIKHTAATNHGATIGDKTKGHPHSSCACVTYRMITWFLMIWIQRFAA